VGGEGADIEGEGGVGSAVGAGAGGRVGWGVGVGVGHAHADKRSKTETNGITHRRFMTVCYSGESATSNNPPDCYCKWMSSSKNNLSYENAYTNLQSGLF